MWLSNMIILHQTYLFYIILQKAVVQDVGRSAGIQGKGMSKRDIIIESNKRLQSDAVYDKIFRKIPGASGK